MLGFDFKGKWKQGEEKVKMFYHWYSLVTHRNVAYHIVIKWYFKLLASVYVKIYIKATKRLGDPHY